MSPGALGGIPVRRKDPEEMKKRLLAFERVLERFLKEADLTEEAFAKLVERAKAG